MASSAFPNRPFNLREHVWLISQDVANNRSRVGFQAWIDKTGTSPTHSAGAAGRWMYLDGGLVASNTTPGFDFTGAGPWLILSGEAWINHNADGTKTFHVQLDAGYDILGSTTVHADVTLPTIPRKSTATFSGGSSLTAGTAVTINTNRASTSFTHEIQIFFGSYGETVATGVGASYSYTPPLSLLQEIPDATSGPGTLRLLTFAGATYLGYTDTPFTLKAGPGVVPTISGLTASDDNAAVVSHVGQFVQGLSILKAVVNAAGVQGSTITSRTFTMSGRTASSGGTLPVTAAGTVLVTAKATDSRSRTASFSGSISALAYAPPLFTTVLVRRSGSTGTVDENGTYLRVDLNCAVQSLINGTQRNSLTIRVFTRPRGGTTWTPRNVIDVAAGTVTYNSSFVVSGGANYPIDESFDVRVEISDKFNTAAAQTVVATSEVLMHWSKTGVGIGKFHENGVLDVDGNIYQYGNVVLDASDFATNAETQTGTATDKVVNPASLSARTATTSRTGLVELATTAEAVAGTDTARAVTPAGLAALTQAWTARKGTAQSISASTMTNVLSIALPASAPAGMYSVHAVLKTFSTAAVQHFKRCRWGGTELDGTGDAIAAAAGVDVVVPSMWLVDHAGGAVTVFLDAQINGAGAVVGNATRLQIAYLGPL